jgi:hypothetical protein
MSAGQLDRLRHETKTWGKGAVQLKRSEAKSREAKNAAECRWIVEFVGGGIARRASMRDHAISAIRLRRAQKHETLRYASSAAYVGAT